MYDPKPYGLNELREMFLSFFESKGHLRLPSFSLIPQNDASLLLINSGMAPMKPFFTGEQEPPRRRVTTCQKCIRTGDIENIGHTARPGSTAPAPAAPAPRSTTTGARSTAAASPAAPWAVTVTAIWRSGTWCSPSSTTMARATTPN